MNFKEYLNEAKLTMAKVTAGDVGTVTAKGSEARALGIKDKKMFNGGEIKILGFGYFAYDDNYSKSQILAKNIKDFKTKNKDFWNEKGADYFFSANHKLTSIVQMYAQENGKKVGNGTAGFLYQHLDGDKKGELGIIFISTNMSDKWVIYYNGSTYVEFVFEK